MQDFFNWQGVVGTVIGFIGTIFGWLAWQKSKEVERFLEQEKARLNEKIEIVLTDKKTLKSLPPIRRQEVTRSEIQGRIRLVPTVKNAPYSIKYLISDEFFRQIDSIIEGANEKGDTKLVIKCTDEEFAQFHLAQPQIEAKKIIRRTKKTDGK